MSAHVVIRPPATFLCLHCSEHYEMATPVSFDIMIASSKAFDKTHKGCKLDAAKGEACPFCFRFGHDTDGCPSTEYKGDPRAWRNGPDTGTSAIAIYSVMTKSPCRDFYPPSDPSDFGRCYRLLKAFPKFRERLHEMDVHKPWRALVSHWDELEEMYESGDHAAMYARMKQLEKAN